MACSPGRPSRRMKLPGMRPGGVELFLKLNAQREEVDAFAGLFAHGDVAEHTGLTIADHCAAVGQATHFAGLDDKGTACKGGFELAVVGKVSLRDANSSAIQVSSLGFGFLAAVGAAPAAVYAWGASRS